MLFDVPYWITAIVYMFPIVIAIIFFHKIYQLLSTVIQKVRRKSETDKMDTFLKFVPYLFMFYYIGRFAVYIFVPATWGWTGEEYSVVSVRNSTLVMQELLLLEGIPVILFIMIATTIFRIANVFVRQRGVSR